MAANEVLIKIKAKDQASGPIGGIVGKLKSIPAPALAAIAAIGGIAIVAFKVASDFDTAYNTIRLGTGATGDALDALKDDFKAALAQVPDDMAAVSTAIADVNTRMGLTGPALQDMTVQFLALARATGDDVEIGIATTTRAFGDWAIAQEDQTAAMDHSFKVSQATGIGYSELLDKVVTFGAPMRAFGFSFESATILMGKWEKEGVNSEAILAGLKMGSAKFAEEGVSAEVGLKQFIDRITELGPGAEATALAMEKFGSRAGPDMVAAVLEGRFELEALTDTIAAAGDTIQSAAEDTLTLGDRFSILKNKAMVAAEPVLTKMLEGLEEIMIAVTPWLEENIPKGIDAIKSAFEDVRPALEGLWAAFKLGLDTIRPPLEALFNFVADHKTVMIAAIAAIGVAIVLAFGPVAVGFLAITGLIIVIGLLRENWDTITDAITGRIDDFITKVEELPVIGDIFMGIRDVVTAQIQDIIDFINQIVTVAGELISFFTNVFQGDWSAAWTDLKDIATGILQLLLDFLQLGFIDDIAMLFSGMFADLLTMFTEKFTEIKDATIEKLGDILGAITGWITDAVLLYVNFYADVLRKLVTWGMNMATAITDVMGELFNIVKYIWTAILNITTAMWEGIKDAIVIPIEAARDVVLAVVRAITDAINSIPNPLDFVPSLPSFGSLNPLNWHQGGIVPGTPGQNVPAILQAGERITSARDVDAGGGHGGITQNFYIEDRSPAALAHAVEMAGLALGEQLALEGA